MVTVKECKIGKGVFAKQKFKKGDVIGEARGSIVKWKELPEESSYYCIELNQKEVLDPQAPFRFLNHSCLPNAFLQVKRKKVKIIAKKAIRIDDEITIDYYWETDKTEHPVSCLCGTSKCRGII